MPNNKRNQALRNEEPNPSEREKKRTPSAGADKSGAALGKQSTKAHDKGAAVETADRKSSRGR
jgi:hypothetical protein